jgi:hypothetical protein
MKKMLQLLLALCISTSLLAQTKPAPAAAKTNTKPTIAVKAVGPKKADGTLDMRYKANKEAVRAAGPRKKDGTLDMRYKANQEKVKKGKG